MTRLGAILAGGQARRFGGDKAAALVDGTALLARVAAALRPQCDALVVVGRHWPGLTTVADWPQPGLGPLGGLAGALRHAGARGFEEVLTSGCDLPEVPPDLADRLTPGPAVIADQPLLGLWPAALCDRLVAQLTGGGSRAMRRWIEASGGRAVALGAAIPNINTRAELSRYLAQRARHGD